MRNILLGTAIAVSVALAVIPASAKTVKECDAEYAANKAAIKATQRKADFIAACRAGTEAIPGAAAALRLPPPPQPRPQHPHQQHQPARAFSDGRRWRQPRALPRRPPQPPRGPISLARQLKLRPAARALPSSG